MSATLTALVGDERVVCRTRDMSEVGVCLDTVAPIEPGTRVSLALFDPAVGAALEVAGEVVRRVEGSVPELGIKIAEPSPEWQALVAQAQAQAVTGTAPVVAAQRLRILVVGDEHRQRGAMALYVTSGWDVLFASDPAGVTDAARNVALDAVIAELDHDVVQVTPWLTLEALMTQIRRMQPHALRIARGASVKVAQIPEGLIDIFVERDAGLPAVLAALTEPLDD